MKALRSLPVADISCSYQVQKLDKELKLLVQIKNKSDTIAFFLRVLVINSNNDEFIAPVLWNENCLTLLPYEKFEISGKILNYSTENIKIMIDGWNTKQINDNN